MVPLPEEPAFHAALVSHLQRLKHDLGKYIAMQQRWLGPDPELAELLDALRTDLLSTRRGPDDTRNAVAVWGDFAPLLLGGTASSEGEVFDLSADADVRGIQVAMAEIAEGLPLLQHEHVDEPRIHRLHEASMAVSEACRNLVRRAKQSEDSWPKS